MGVQGRIGLMLAVVLMGGSTLGCQEDAASRAAPADSKATGCAALFSIDSFDVDHESPDFPASLAPLAALWRSVASSSDGEVAAGASMLATAVDEAVASGDVSRLESDDPALAAAEGAAHRWAFDSCPLSRTTLEAEEYAFKGAPSTLAAGKVAWQLRNDGHDDHMMVLARIKDGVDLPLDRLMEGDEAAINARIDVVASSGMAVAGASGYLLAELSPGRHVLFDPLPASADQAPHYTHGMVVAFTVTS